jgi:DNA mismatch endonuclease Vsr
MDRHSKKQRRKNMQAVKSKGSKIERLLAKELWAMGLRYRKNYKELIGKPDFAFIGSKVAVFCDSEFFHGKNWSVKKHEIKSNREFWHKKIEGNIRRDKEVNKALLSAGWTVIRFWGKEIKDNPRLCAEKVYEAVKDD